MKKPRRKCTCVHGKAANDATRTEKQLREKTLGLEGEEAGRRRRKAKREGVAQQ